MTPNDEKRLLYSPEEMQARKEKMLSELRKDIASNTGVPDNMLTEPEGLSAIEKNLNKWYEKFRQNLSVEDAIKIVKTVDNFDVPTGYNGLVGQALAVLIDYIDNTKSFLNFVTREIFDESNKEFDNWDAFCELACRRLVKLDAIKLEDGNYMLKEEDEKTYVKSDVIKRDDYDWVVARIRALSPDNFGTDDYDDGYFACKLDVTRYLNDL